MVLVDWLDETFFGLDYHSKFAVVIGVILTLDKDHYGVWSGVRSYRVLSVGIIAKVVLILELLEEKGEEFAIDRVKSHPWLVVDVSLHVLFDNHDSDFGTFTFGYLDIDIVILLHFFRSFNPVGALLAV